MVLKWLAGPVKHKLFFVRETNLFVPDLFVFRIFPASIDGLYSYANVSFCFGHRTRLLSKNTIIWGELICSPIAHVV